MKTPGLKHGPCLIKRMRRGRYRKRVCNNEVLTEAARTADVKRQIAVLMALLTNAAGKNPQARSKDGEQFTILVSH